MQGENPQVELPPETSAAPESKASGSAWLLAGLSATVFGALGAWAGRSIGSKGGEHGVRMLGKTFWTWTVGLATAMAAGYSTLKTNVAHEKERAKLREVNEDLSETAQVLAQENQELKQGPTGTPVRSEPSPHVALDEATRMGVIRQMEMGTPTFH